MKEDVFIREVPDREKIEAYRKVPALDKLRWLWETKVFLYHTMPRENWDLMQNIRRGVNPPPPESTD